MFEYPQTQKFGTTTQLALNPYVKHILGFIAFISLMLITLGGLLWQEHERDVRSFTIITEYHLLSEQKLERIMIEVGLLQNNIAEYETPKPAIDQNEAELLFTNKTNSITFAIDQHMASLRTIQNRFQDSIFQASLERLETSVSNLKAALHHLTQTHPFDFTETELSIEILNFRLAQHERLHTSIHETLLSYTAESRVKSRTILALISGAIVLSIFVISGLTLRRVSRLAKAQHSTETELMSALSAAQKANAAKTDFLAHMSHDLRTPLNSILGFSQMMRVHTFGPLGDSHYEEYAKLIHHSGERLVSMVNDVLDFARIESGEYRVKNVKINILEQAQNCFQRCVAMPYHELDNRYSLVIDEDAPALKSDERALSQILDNLLSNALKYAGDKAKFSIEWHIDSEGRGILSVVDTGRGIPQRQLKKVIEPFVQGGTLVESSPHIARTGEGVGLGLHIVTKLCAILGAEFVFESEEGKGTSASLVFPANKLI